MTIYGTPTNEVFGSNQEDLATALSPGGPCRVYTAHQALAWGDMVYLTLGGRVGKSLESSLYQSFFAGVVVGGTTTNMQASTDSGLIGVAMSAKGEQVLVQYSGICYVSCDTTGILIGNQLSAGRTTAGRARGDAVISGAWTVPGLAIKAGASVLVKAVNVTQTVVAGVPGTATAANLDMAALAGTVTAGAYNVFAFRVAANGTTVSSAMGTEGATINDIVWPTASAVLPTLGCVLIHPTGVGNFVGGTTALDDATVIPNAVYYDFVMQYTPTVGLVLANGGAAGTALKVLLQ